MKNEKHTSIVAIIFTIALILRCLYWIFLKNNYFFYHTPSTDVLFYQQWAKQIATQSWLGREAFYGMPLYPYFLAVLEGLSAGNLFLVRLAHIFLGSLNCLLVYVLAKRLFSSTIGLLAMFLTAINFTLIYYDLLLMPVTLLITLSLIVLILFKELSQSLSFRQWFFFGLILGISILGDGKFLIFFVLLVLYLILKNKEELSKIFTRVVIPLCLGTLFILSSVVLRNKMICGEWIFISAHSGINFYIGNNPKAQGTFANPEFLRPTHQAHIEDPRLIVQESLGRKASLVEVNDYWNNKAFDFIRRSPMKYLKLLQNKATAFFIDNESSYDLDLLLQRTWKDLFDVNSFRIILSFAIIGMILSWKSPWPTAPVNLLLFSQLAFTLIFFLTNRHRATILPLLIIYQSFTFCWFFDKLKTQKFKPALVAGLIFLALFFCGRERRVPQQTIDFLSLSKSGPVYDSQGKYKKAQSYYLQALKIRPLDSNTLYNLGTSYLLDNNFAKAQPTLLKAQALNPLDGNVLYNLGITSEKLKNDEKAIEFYQKVIDLSPTSIDAHLRIAQLYQKRHNCPRTEEHIKIIQNLRPELKEKLEELINTCK